MWKSRTWNQAAANCQHRVGWTSDVKTLVYQGLHFYKGAHYIWVRVFKPKSQALYINIHQYLSSQHFWVTADKTNFTLLYSFCFSKSASDGWSLAKTGLRTHQKEEQRRPNKKESPIVFFCDIRVSSMGFMVQQNYKSIAVKGWCIINSPLHIYLYTWLEWFVSLFIFELKKRRCKPSSLRKQRPPRVSLLIFSIILYQNLIPLQCHLSTS